MARKGEKGLATGKSQPPTTRSRHPTTDSGLPQTQLASSNLQMVVLLERVLEISRLVLSLKPMTIGLCHNEIRFQLKQPAKSVWVRLRGLLNSPHLSYSSLAKHLSLSLSLTLSLSRYTNNKIFQKQLCHFQMNSHSITTLKQN